MLKGDRSDSDIELAMESIESRKKKLEKALSSHEDLKKPQEQEEEEKQYSIRFLILDYFEYTSGHGPPRILASRQLIRKIFWILLFLAALGVSVWQITELFKTYQARPLATHVAIQHETSLDFPAITICNFNAVKLSSVEYLPEDLRNDILGALEDLKGAPARRRKRAAGLLKDPAEPSEEEEEGFENPDSLEEDFRRREELIMVMAETDTEELIPLGHAFEDFVLSCTYRGIPCGNFTSSYWTNYWHYSYGNCYIFNAGRDKKGKTVSVLKSNKPGPSHGLVLELNIQQQEYIGAFAEEAGVRIDISNQGEMAFPREKGLSAPPGFATSIGMRKVEIIREDPFNNNRCFNANKTKLDEANLYNHTFKVGYSSSACKESCLAFNQRKECKCMEYRFPIPSNATPVCNILNKTVVNCLSKVQKAFKRNELNCTKSCPPPCRENVFKLTSSFSSWPSEAYQAFYVEQLASKGIELEIENRTNNFRSNVLKLNIFYEELNYEFIREERSYVLVNFVSDLGGSLGLWIGMSVLSFAEVLELLLLIAYALCRKLRRRLDGRIQSSSQSVRKAF
ncbi:ligand-gated sodium channel [Porites harrisoni]